MAYIGPVFDSVRISDGLPSALVLDFDFCDYCHRFRSDTTPLDLYVCETAACSLPLCLSCLKRCRWCQAFVCLTCIENKAHDCPKREAWQCMINFVSFDNEGVNPQLPVVRSFFESTLCDRDLLDEIFKYL